MSAVGTSGAPNGMCAKDECCFSNMSCPQDIKGAKRRIFCQSFFSKKAHSSSIVLGGLFVMSYTTFTTLGISFVILVLNSSNTR